MLLKYPIKVQAQISVDFIVKYISCILFVGNLVAVIVSALRFMKNIRMDGVRHLQ
jgi:hypothetical protein